MKGSLRIFIILLFFLIAFIIFANVTLYRYEQHGISTENTLPPGLELKHIFQITPNDHEEWLPVLRHGKLKSFIDLKFQHTNSI
jgi:hypothetical protein